MGKTSNNGPEMRTETRRSIAKEKAGDVNLSDWVSKFKRMPTKCKSRALNTLLMECSQELLVEIKESSSLKLLKDVVGDSSTDMVREIFLYLEPKDLVNCMLVSRRWNHLARDNLLWKRKCDEVNYEAIKLNSSKKRKLRRSTRRREVENKIQPGDWYQNFLHHARIRENWVKNREKSSFHLRCGQFKVTSTTSREDLVVCGTESGRLLVFSLTLKKKLRTIRAHASEIHNVFILNDNERVVSASVDNTLAVFSARGGRRLHTIRGHDSECEHMMSDGNYIAAYYENDNVRIFDVDAGVTLSTFRVQPSVSSMFFVAGNVLLGLCNGDLQLWDQNGQLKSRFGSHGCEVDALYIDTEAELVVSCAVSGIINVRRLHDGSLVQTLDCRRSSEVLFLRQNKLISIGTDACIWDWKTGRVIATVAGKDMHCDGIDQAEFIGHDLMATSGEDGTVKLWNTNTGEFIRNVANVGQEAEVFYIQATETGLTYIYEDDDERSVIAFMNFDIK